jgi:hypothetical protein
MQSVCFWPSVAHCLSKQSVLNGHLSFTATNFWSPGFVHNDKNYFTFQFVVLYKGWRTYMKYSVSLAGLALAALYMTVLGFDNITVGECRFCVCV